MTENVTEQFIDRTPRLALVGVVQLCFGALFSLLLVAFLVAALFVPILMVETVVLFTILGGLAAWFITLGLGSMRTRRWARALTLVMAWIYVVTAVNGMASLAFAPAHAEDAILSFSPEVNDKLSAAIAVLHVAISCLFIWACSGADAKATCAYYNPAPSWTDRRPLPILALCLLYGLWIVLTPVAGINGWAFSFFGVLLSGYKGAAAHVALAAVLLCLLWGTWRMRPRIWLCSLVFATIYGLSWVISAATISPMEFYAAMNAPEASMEDYMATSWRLWQTFNAAYYAILAVGLIVYTKRYFADEETPESVIEPPGAS